MAGFFRVRVGDTSWTGFEGRVFRRPQPDGWRTGIPAAFKYPVAISGRTPVPSIRRSALTADVIKSSEIEGENSMPDSSVRPLAQRPRIDIGVFTRADRNVEGTVEMMLDATRHSNQPLTSDRLFAGHASLFSDGPQWNGKNQDRGLARR
ncbi:MAG: hypothetical protein ABUS49_10360 [Acidobacteriota bacterium]